MFECVKVVDQGETQGPESEILSEGGPQEPKKCV